MITDSEKWLYLAVKSLPALFRGIKSNNNGEFYCLNCFCSYRIMSSSLSSLVDNLSEGLHSDKCTDCKSCLDYMTTKDEHIVFRCSECKKNYKKDFNKELIKRFAYIYDFANEYLSI